jgi:MarR family 2-MHQ and catechol resistance regulon transcriptional repressor
MPTSSILPDASASTLGSREQAALKLWVVLTKAHAAIAEHAQEDARAVGLTIGEFAVLEMLHHKGPTLLGEIQRRVLVSSGGITFLVDRLEKKGLVERQNCPSDRRARYAVLTPKGDALIREIFPTHARRIADVMSTLTDAEQRSVTELIRRLGIAAADSPIVEYPDASE